MDIFSLLTTVYITCINFILYLAIVSVMLETNEDIAWILYIALLLVIGLFIPFFAYLTLGILAAGISLIIIPFD